MASTTNPAAAGSTSSSFGMLGVTIPAVAGFAMMVAPVAYDLLFVRRDSRIITDSQLTLIVNMLGILVFGLIILYHYLQSVPAASA
ncbi:hypothetical protein HK405_005145 [Cladochytrium tenue]|nr:hypothetical protein HK405_005145 [Cladochytrium tenue]